MESTFTLCSESDLDRARRLQRGTCLADFQVRSSARGCVEGKIKGFAGKAGRMLKAVCGG